MSKPYNYTLIKTRQQKCFLGFVTFMRKFVFYTQLKTGSLAVLNRINALSNIEVLPIQVHIMKKGLNIDKSLIQTQLHVLPTISPKLHHTLVFRSYQIHNFFHISLLSNTAIVKDSHIHNCKRINP